MQVCATRGNGDCCGMWTGNIQVMYCPSVNDTQDVYVYKFIHSVLCDSAYCAVDRSDVYLSSDLLTTGIDIAVTGIITSAKEVMFLVAVCVFVCKISHEVMNGF